MLVKSDHSLNFQILMPVLNFFYELDLLKRWNILKELIVVAFHIASFGSTSNGVLESHLISRSQPLSCP